MKSAHKPSTRCHCAACVLWQNGYATNAGVPIAPVNVVRAVDPQQRAPLFVPTYPATVLVPTGWTVAR